jgi:hypothetical protein
MSNQFLLFVNKFCWISIFIAWPEWCQSETKTVRQKKEPREILLLLRLRGIARMIDLKMQIKK